MNKNKSLPFIIGAIVIIVGLVIVFTTGTTKKSASVPSTNTNPSISVPTTTTTTTTVTPTKPSTSTTSSSSTSSASTPGMYTLADVAKHNSASNCWTTINGGVYNVTSWINQHPGGAGAIISLCGIDGSAAFNDQHGGERRPASELTSFKIGILK